MEEQTKYVFEVKHRYGQTVRLRTVVYERHRSEHPEMTEYIEEAEVTVTDPDVELLDEEAGGNCHVYYRLGLGRDEFEKCFVKVPVYYDEVSGVQEGEVATFHLTRRLGRGRRIWQRR